MNNRHITVDELINCYCRDNNCRDVMQARTALESAALEARANGNEQAKRDGLYLLDRLRQWDEQQAKQKANTAPPPKQKPYATPQTNGANQAPPQTNTAQAYPDGYNAWTALSELIIQVSTLAIGFTVLYIIGGVVVNALKGFGDGVLFSIERGTPYALGIILGCVGLLGLKEFFTKKETPTTQTGGTGYIVNNYYYGDGTTAERK